jgi:hypothetical protein
VSGLRGVKRRPELPFGFSISRLNAKQQVDGKRHRLRCGRKIIDDFKHEEEAIREAIELAPLIFGPEPTEPVHDVDADTLARLRAARDEAQGVRR